MVHELIAEAKDLIAKAEADLEDVVGADETHLRLAVHRLGMFVEHVAGQRAREAEKPAEPERVEEAAPAAEESDEDAPKRPRRAKAAPAAEE